MRALIIEDNQNIRLSLKRGLQDIYVIEFAGHGEQGVLLAKQNDHDIIVLDLGLPDISGFEVCTAIRAHGIPAPILILSADIDSKQKISLLNAGADDYLTKPFSLEELKARMRALLRRGSAELKSNRLRIADLQLDCATRTVTRAAQEITLRRKEFDLLEYLMRNQGYTVSRSMVMDHVWGAEKETYTNAIDVHIKYLRDKVDKPFGIHLIKTVHGVGYKIDAGTR
jgi:two-component system OmpR family response regulator